LNAACLKTNFCDTCKLTIKANIATATNDIYCTHPGVEPTNQFEPNDKTNVVVTQKYKKTPDVE
jgi:hypothetical protein